MSRWFTVQNDTRQSELADKVELAASFGARLKGLLGRDGLPEGQGLWIDPCNSVHTFFMRFPIDVLFLDKSQRVVRVLIDLPARRMTRVHLAATTCLELRAGGTAKSGTRAGDQLRFIARDRP